MQIQTCILLFLSLKKARGSAPEDLGARAPQEGRASSFLLTARPVPACPVLRLSRGPHLPSGRGGLGPRGKQPRDGPVSPPPVLVPGSDPARDPGLDPGTALNEETP